MHQPRTIANKERVRLVNGEVEHGLVSIVEGGDPLDCAVVAIQRANLVASKATS